MFVIGMELDLKVLRNKANDAVVISHASIVIPFALGIGLAYFIYTSFAPVGVEFLSFGLFLGIAMSITAFPVLARIVQERGLQKKPVWERSSSPVQQLMTLQLGAFWPRSLPLSRQGPL